MSPLPTKLLMSWEGIGTDHPDVPAFIIFSDNGMRPSHKPLHRIVQLRVRLPQSALTMNLFYWFELQSISEFKAALRMGYFGFGPYSTFLTFIQGILMVTSQRTL